MTRAADRAARTTVAALALAALAGGCTEVSTDPAVVAAIGVDSLPSTTIVTGDTLRGITLEPTPLRVRVFAGSGDTIPGAEVVPVLLDTATRRAITVTPERFVIGRAAVARARFILRSGPVQTAELRVGVIDSVPRLARGDTLADSLFYDAADTTLRIGEVQLRATQGTGPAAADGFRVAIETVRLPAQLDSIAFFGPNGRRVVGAITGGDGLARVRVRAFARAGATGADTIVLRARLRARGAEVPGSPLRLVLLARGVP